jgi:hypothetical protein
LGEFRDGIGLRDSGQHHPTDYHAKCSAKYFCTHKANHKTVIIDSFISKTLDVANVQNSATPDVRCQPRSGTDRADWRWLRFVRKHEGRHGAHTRSTLSARMKHTNPSTPAVAAVQSVNHQPQTRTLKLALEVHLLQHVVAMQYDGQPITRRSFLPFIPLS